MAREIKLTFWALALIFVALMSILVYRQVFSAQLAEHPGNQRALLAEYSIDRGSIFSSDGEVLAESYSDGDIFKRRYPLGVEAAAITGYWNPIRGRSGLEETYNQWLTGSDKFATIDDWFSDLVNKRSRGNDLTLTIDAGLQRTAWNALGDRRGSVVVLDPSTGAVLAMVSKPGYDPNNIDKDWSVISSDTAAPLVNRAVAGRYPPGSIFKIITVSGALERGLTQADTVYDGPVELPVGGGKVRNFADEGSGRQKLADAFAHSTNTIFAQVGLKLGAADLVQTATDFGFNQPLDFDLPTSKSTIPEAGSMDKVLLAWSAVGQGETLVTPLQMALVAAGIANDGNIPRPYLVKSVRDYRGKIVKTHEEGVLRRATDAKTAGIVSKMMLKVVESGTAKKIWSPKLNIAGKTGTAETGDGQKSHAWFVAFAPAENPQVAVAVIVEHGGLGGSVAAPIAREVISAALAQR